jgi:hypothetical protein
MTRFGFMELLAPFSGTNRASSGFYLMTETWLPVQGFGLVVTVWATGHKLGICSVCGVRTSGTVLSSRNKQERY